MMQIAKPPAKLGLKPLILLGDRLMVGQPIRHINQWRLAISPFCSHTKIQWLSMCSAKPCGPAYPPLHPGKIRGACSNAVHGG